MYKELKSDRLTLRRAQPGDAEVMFVYRSNPDIFRYQGWEPETVDEVRSIIESIAELEPGAAGKWFQYAIVLDETGIMVGDLGVHGHDEEPHQTEFGITIAPQFQGKGYACEAVVTVLEFLFEELEVHRVYGSVDQRNTASIALMDRLGFRKEAHMVESLWFKGEWADDLIFAMLDREWEQKKK